MVHDRRRIIRSNAASAPRLVVQCHEMRLVSPRRSHRLEFGDIPADVSSVKIKLLALYCRIEDAVPAHRVRAGGCTPLPVSIVGGRVRIEQMTHEIPLPALPVDPQILD